ncbi:helix-turn-helix domain-containing protein [Edwardsiella ictaluri]|uniref:helix-turn-helix domain-containing protein n=1 Tax=Edwardsiella ictaluri TaxID=67780 RepID=UPI0039F735AA
MNENTFADRLSLAMAEAKMTQASLAEAVGMAQPSVWKLTSGKAKSSRKVVEIAAVLGVQPEWLSAGRGPMRKDNGVVISSLPLPKDDSYIISVMDISLQLRSREQQQRLPGYHPVYITRA